jgi:glycerophosphoryl diester phosphodiesterase
VIVYGHRGARGEAPENTIAGGAHAVARGVRHLEIDLRLSKDEQLVVLHDERLKRTAAAAGKVSDYTAQELAALDARADGPPWPNKRRTGVPSLSALVKALPQVKHWQLELKGGRPRYNDKLAAATVDWLKNNRLPCVVTSSDTDLLMAVKHQLPRQATGYVSTTADPGEVLERCGCEYLIAHWSTALDAATLKPLQARGIHISTWTVNDASVIEALYQLKIDSVISDFPSMALPLVATLAR